MPRKPINYKKSIIYKITTGDSVYVGSTTDFTKRKSSHKSRIYNEKDTHYNYKLYRTIRENGGEWDMKPYKEYPCENKIQLLIEEERIRCELNADLNTNVCAIGLSKEEYHKEYIKEWRKANKEKIAEQTKEYYEQNKDKIAEKNKERKKEYYKQNAEQIKEKAKEYKEQNREQIAKKNAEKITCECGCIVSRISISRHKTSKKHLKWVESQN